MEALSSITAVGNLSHAKGHNHQLKSLLETVVVPSVYEHFVRCPHPGCLALAVLRVAAKSADKPQVSRAPMSEME